MLDEEYCYDIWLSKDISELNLGMVKGYLRLLMQPGQDFERCALRIGGFFPANKLNERLLCTLVRHSAWPLAPFEHRMILRIARMIEVADDVLLEQRAQALEETVEHWKAYGVAQIRYANVKSTWGVQRGI